MHRYVTGILICIALSLVFLIAFDVFSRNAPAPIIPSLQPHAYGNTAESIADIYVTAVYFVPRDATPVLDDQWKNLLESELSRLVQFHHVQFRGTSNIRYAIHSRPLIGRSAHDIYDVDILQHDNPLVLRPVAEEVLKALSLELIGGSSYHVLLVLYEGEGAGGSTHQSLISRNFFERADTHDFAGTFLAHEFYHALGIPDAYETAPKVYADNAQVDVELIRSRDIMGRVRIPLEEAYIAPATLTAMGL